MGAKGVAHLHLPSSICMHVFCIWKRCSGWVGATDALANTLSHNDHVTGPVNGSDDFMLHPTPRGRSPRDTPEVTRHTSRGRRSERSSRLTPQTLLCCGTPCAPCLQARKRTGSVRVCMCTAPPNRPAPTKTDTSAVDFQGCRGGGGVWQEYARTCAHTGAIVVAAD
jgi:hypothetical protein